LDFRRRAPDRTARIGIEDFGPGERPATWHDKALADPAHPGVIATVYDGGDHLHPNDAGYRAMGEAIDLKVFE
jgi:lysophospholipase L1-like esterase